MPETRVHGHDIKFYGHPNLLLIGNNNNYDNNYDNQPENERVDDVSYPYYNKPRTVRSVKQYIIIFS